MTPEEISLQEPFLKRIPFFSGLPSEDIASIAACLQPVSLSKGSVLFKPGDDPDAFYIITSGQVGILHAFGESESMVAVLGRGEIIGEGGLLTGEPRSMTVKLLTTCEFLKMMRKDFEQMLRDRPSVLLHISRVLARRLVPAGGAGGEAGRTHSQLVSLSAALRDDERLLFCLHLALELLEQSRRSVILVDMSAGAGGIAKALGLAPLMVSRSMLLEANFRDPGLIKTMIQQHASGLKILNLPAAVFDEFREQAIYLFLNILRESHDYVLVCSGVGASAAQKAVLSEADAVFLAGSSSCKPQYRRMEGQMIPAAGSKRIARIWLGDMEPEDAAAAAETPPQAFPWPQAIAAEYARTKSPYAALDCCPPAKNAISRLARGLSGLKVGLALGSGAAFGFAHIGVLKVFKRHGIPVDAVSGSSMGSFLGGMFALGMEPEEMEQIACSIDRGWVYENLLWDLTVPRSGFFAGETLLRLLRSYFGSKEFRDIPTPFACVATDIENGEEIVLREGRVAESIRASCGIPMIFSPYRLSGRYLVDGGLVNPVPVSVLPSLGADIFIASEVIGPINGSAGRVFAQKEEGVAAAGAAILESLPLPGALKAPSMFRTFSQMFFTMETWVAQARLGLADVVIRPELAGFSWTQLDKAKALIEEGERAAEQYLPKIKSLLPFFSDSCQVP
ncbi:MAG: patatin-like phospholipase family protein, partial [Elusimicrobia bacterium]|nr:patatin-like phospholipase family protein [Elusimicrobiota bacterium]